MSTTGNIARLFYEEFFQTSVEYQTHIAITTQADKTLEKTRLNMFTFRNNAVST